MNWYKKASKEITLYRGEHSTNKNGHYYSLDKEFARQFTQSGQDKEIITRRINPCYLTHTSSSLLSSRLFFLDSSA